MQAALRRDRKELTESLHRVTRSDAEGQELKRFFDNHARFSRLIDRRQVDYETGTDLHRIEGGPDVPIRDFLVTIASQEERKRFEIDSDANFQYIQEWNAIFLPPLTTFTPIWMGIRFAHELRHAFDFLTGIEPLNRDDEASNLAFAQGERRGHGLEQKLLDQFTHGAFTQGINELARRFPPPAHFPNAWFVPKSYQQVNLLDTYFPPIKSAAEKDSRFGSYVMALNFHYAEVLELGEEGKTRFTLNYFRSKWGR